MNWFRLDPESIIERVKASNMPAHPPTFAGSVWRGVIGFTVVSVAGFLPWVVAGTWFYRNVGELAMYLTCAGIFVGLSGLLLHPLIIGPGSLNRFYVFFSVAFTAYSIAWIAGWMGLRGQTTHLRSIVGLLAGTAVMGVLFGIAFEARRVTPKIITVLFVLNSLGYFTGGWIEGCLAHVREYRLFGVSLSGSALTIFMKVIWGVCFGTSFGAGLGWAFHLAQARARELLKDTRPS